MMNIPFAVRFGVALLMTGISSSRDTAADDMAKDRPARAVRLAR